MNKRVNKKVFFLFSILSICLCSFGWAQTPIDFPEKALQLIAESIRDTCSICAKQTREKAFRLFEEQFPAGRTFATTASCRLIKSALAEENELVLSCDASGEKSLPLLIFRFHTPASHLVGISLADYTDEEVARPYRSAASGTAFDGVLQTAAYHYGDGTTFNYFSGRKIIHVHCRLLRLTPVSR